MRKWKCQVCGYIHTGDAPPDVCPVCYSPREKFLETKADEGMTLPAYVDSNIKGETWEVTHYMAMALKAQTLGLGEVADGLFRIASEEAYHGSNFIHRAGKAPAIESKLDSSSRLSAELKKDMEMMLTGELGAHKGKNQAASLARAEGHYELAGFFAVAAADEARHAEILKGLMKKYF